MAGEVVPAFLCLSKWLKSVSQLELASKRTTSSPAPRCPTPGFPDNFGQPQVR